MIGRRGPGRHARPVPASPAGVQGPAVSWRQATRGTLGAMKDPGDDDTRAGDATAQPDGAPGAPDAAAGARTGPRASDETTSPDGVDLTLVRWMLSLTPAERLQVLQEGARGLHGLLGAATRR